MLLETIPMITVLCSLVATAWIQRDIGQLQREVERHEQGRAHRQRVSAELAQKAVTR